MTGIAMAFGLLSALTAARTTGEGRDIDVSLFDLALGNLNYLAAWHLNAGDAQARKPRSAHPTMTPCQLFPTADGWIFLMCNKEKFWPALCEKLGQPGWAEDPRFRTFPDRLANRDAVVALLDGALKQRTTAEWLVDFAGVVPAAPVLDVAQALDNPFVTEQGRLQTLEHPDAGAFRLVAPPVRSAGDAPPANPAPPLGGDTDDILGKLGYDEARIAGLRKGGVI